MRRFKNILAVCRQDASDKGLFERVAELAKANEAKVTLITVIDTSAGDLARLASSLPGVRAHDAEYQINEYHQSYLDENAALLEAKGIPTGTAVVQGTPFLEVIRQVLIDDYDLVMKQAEGKVSGLRRLFASVDMHLMRKCPCPVWIIQPDQSVRNRRILAAVDPDPDDAVRDAVSRMVMDLATSLSRIDDAELHVVHAWRLYGENAMRHSAFLKTSEENLQALLAEQERVSREKLSQLLSKYDIVLDSSRVHLIKGEAAEVLAAFAHSNEIDAIIMGTVGRTGVQGLLIGDTAETLLHQVACSILAIKPPGFETPVAA